MEYIRIEQGVIVHQSELQVRNQRCGEVNHRALQALRFAQEELGPLHGALSQCAHNFTANALVERAHLPECLHRAQYAQTAQQELQSNQRRRMQCRKYVAMTSNLVQRFIDETVQCFGQPLLQFARQRLLILMAPQTVDVQQTPMHELRIERCGSVQLCDGYKSGQRTL